MKYWIISVVLLWAFFQLSSFIWSSKGQPPSTTFTRLLESPEQRLLDPNKNGYFYLLGFGSATALDPAKVGYEIWRETNVTPVTSEFDYEKPGRLDLKIEVPVEEGLPSWNFESPANQFRNLNTGFQPVSDRDRTLLARYERWLTMPFEDMGFGHHGTPRFLEIYLAHRLYIVDGFSRQTTVGMQRLTTDLQMWRSVLQNATTIATKVMAQIAIADDLRLLSAFLSQPIVNKTVLAMTSNIAPPLTTAESSLHWPLQHQFRLGVHRNHTGKPATETESLDIHEQWLARMGHLPRHAFRQIAHPRSVSFLGITLQTRETWEMYATYYDAMIQVAEAGQNTLPKLHELTGTTRQSILESVINPNPFEPDWDSFHAQLRETDARLRLASLQAALRRPSTQGTVPNQLAQGGVSYYDPFSGLPMLWSPTQQKIYSVGRDRYDDGGDESFDISVPAIVTRTPIPKESQPAVQTGR
jgi:hypothetical protein